ncbi:L-rhamnose-1-dehydrogenase [Lithohypha guttulata]|uniref:L-rhamnose-1-dehydrogenase n=1 Tax=Lithohypha guttulata TaxID=1690604 RepID=UPI002DE0DB0D|nr:L-rhamnose-1-dehydrogenase [Lithohypha guttulata]KAK5103851.1 L-rhamnose-1-dehydrogenase [Lithohypha guttulata]
MPLSPVFDQQTNPHVLCITGGLTGIGRAIATLFLSHNAFVCINYFPGHNANDQTLQDSLRTEALEVIRSRNPQTSTSKVEDVPLLCVPGDISLPETGIELVRQCVDRFGRLDTFVSNAGICKFEEFLDISPESFSKHRDTNYSGAFYAVQAAARHMSGQTPNEDGSRGSIIGVSSISALVGGAQQAHYTPTKAAVLSLMQSCATALGKYGIRCNALLPGTIRTQLNDEDLKDGSEKKAYMENRIPLRRLGAPSDMAGPALFLAVGELSGYVSGATILVDGGAFVNFQ